MEKQEIRYPFGDKETYKQRYTSAAERSKYPIFDMLSKYLPEKGTALEIASGIGQHMTYFAEKLPKWRFVPTDIDKENLEQLQQRVASIPNIDEPIWLDASQEDWGAVEKKAPFDLIIAINCIHVSPRALHLQLFQKSKNLLNPGGFLFIYAACKVDGQYTNESNKNFDEMLRSTHPEFGLRDVKDMQRLAKENQLECVEVSEMPASNTALLFRKQ
ncbi:hypothetical protein GpartN1_g4177.t1 [Galdieria partita]|uniref:Uncharacterized protein n=1 Tax=Galdieria partita TaxID=83374 RepID=A0A9C7UR38_9RHOD|nr:hypothetical protein GpartN1_g4177.t1 [Galdieria partita]